MGERKLEKVIQREICDYLHARNFFFWRQNTVPVFGRSGDGTMRFRALPKYTPRGLPDIMVIYKGIFYGLEVKSEDLRRGGNPRTSEAQQIIGEKIKENGGRYFVVTSLADVQAIFSTPADPYCPDETLKSPVQAI